MHVELIPNGNIDLYSTNCGSFTFLSIKTFSFGFKNKSLKPQQKFTIDYLAYDFGLFTEAVSLVDVVCICCLFAL